MQKMEQTLEERIAHVDELIDEVEKSLIGSKENLAALKQERRQLEEQRLKISYTKWKIKEGNYYLLFDKEQYNTLVSGIHILRDDPQNSRVQTTTWDYSCYDDEYSFDMEVKWFSYWNLDNMLEDATLYLVSKETYSRVVLQLMDVPEKDGIKPLENYVTVDSLKIN